jgi:hypothetical protein
MSASEVDENEDSSPSIEFEKDQQGEFHFGYVQGFMDCRETTRDGQPAIELTWEGNGEEESCFGRGWAVLKGDELHGMIFFHQGDESDFVARRG